MTKSYFKDLLAAGVDIYLYQNSFLHAKVIAINEKIVSIGSANFNTRSLYLDYEANAVLFNKNIAEDIVRKII